MAYVIVADPINVAMMHASDELFQVVCIYLASSKYFEKLFFKL